MPSRLNYHHLRYFRIVAHEGNLTRAAEALNVSQSALSVQIRALEERLGHVLFERRNRRLHLTEAGHLVLAYADSIAATGEELLATLARGDPTAGRKLRVGALSTLSRNFQTAFLRPVLTRPGVRVVLRSGTLQELMGQLERHELDVVLVNTLPARAAGSPWMAHIIDTQSVSLVGPANRFVPNRDRLECLRSEPLILPAVESSLRMAFDAFCDRAGLEPEIVAEVDDMAMMRALALQNVGLALVPPIVVEQELRDGRLVEMARFEDIVETFHAVTLARRFPSELLDGLLGRRSRPDSAADRKSVQGRE